MSQLIGFRYMRLPILSSNLWSRVLMKSDLSKELVSGETLYRTLSLSRLPCARAPVVGAGAWVDDDVYHCRFT